MQYIALWDKSARITSARWARGQAWEVLYDQQVTAALEMSSARASTKDYLRHRWIFFYLSIFSCVYLAGKVWKKELSDIFSFLLYNNQSI